ncbi:MAG: sulfate adenylyltransferase subunit CysD [Terracidiphilus sp.]|nr:sulfate adenylyltransferase subunit CysD [Terracidiphilus sp.]
MPLAEDAVPSTTDSATLSGPEPLRGPERLSHLRLLEAESIHILREVASEFERPVMLYSIGKDSSVMLRLAQKAFFPGPIPFPLLHIDTGFKFVEMIAFRDWMARQVGADLLVWRNEDAIAAGTNPIALDTKRCCGLLKTQALLDALKHYNFDAAFGGARRDEEKSRAKERIYSFRDGAGQWDPKNQRPELWNLYNARIHPGESIRVFPLSNWTEMDVWQYIHEEKIPVVDLYFAKERPMYVRPTASGQDGLLPIEQGFVARLGEKPQMVKSRLRSLGCSPCTGAIRSDAETIPEIIAELISFRSSERANRVIDHDQEGSMELKKREGYF